MRWTWLIFWGIAGIGMLISQFWLDWFVVDFTYFRLNVGWFAVVYSGLLAYRNVLVKEELQLTPRELHDWGETLSRITPTILELARDGVGPKDIASQLEKSDGVPTLVSLKYMVAVSQYLKDSGGKLPGDDEEVVEQGSDGTAQTDHQQHEK